MTSYIRPQPEYFLLEKMTLEGDRFESPAWTRKQNCRSRIVSVALFAPTSVYSR